LQIAIPIPYAKSTNSRLFPFLLLNHELAEDDVHHLRWILPKSIYQASFWFRPNMLILQGEESLTYATHFQSSLGVLFDILKSGTSQDFHSTEKIVHHVAEQLMTMDALFVGRNLEQ